MLESSPGGARGWALPWTARPAGTGPPPIPPSRATRCKGKPMAYLVPSAPMGGTGLLSDSAQQAPRSCFPKPGKG